MLLVIGDFRLGKKRLNDSRIFLERELIALREFCALAVETAQTFPAYGGATAELHGGPESATDRQVSSQAAHRRSEIQSVAAADTVSPPGCNFAVIDPCPQVTAGDGYAGIILSQQTEPAKGDFYLRGVQVIVQQAVCPEECELIHRPPGGYAHMLVAISAGILDQGEHAWLDNFKAHRVCLPGQGIRPC